MHTHTCIAVLQKRCIHSTQRQTSLASATVAWSLLGFTDTPPSCVIFGEDEGEAVLAAVQDVRRIRTRKSRVMRASFDTTLSLRGTGRGRAGGGYRLVRKMKCWLLGVTCKRILLHKRTNIRNTQTLREKFNRNSDTYFQTHNRERHSNLPMIEYM